MYRADWVQINKPKCSIFLAINYEFSWLIKKSKQLFIMFICYLLYSLHITAFYAPSLGRNTVTRNKYDAYAWKFNGINLAVSSYHLHRYRPFRVTQYFFQPLNVSIENDYHQVFFSTKSEMNVKCCYLRETCDAVTSCVRVASCVTVISCVRVASCVTVTSCVTVISRVTVTSCVTVILCYSNMFEFVIKICDTKSHLLSDIY